MNFRVIVAMDRNGIIGNSATNGLPWPRFPADMARFKKLTTDQIVIMGRKTWDSIPEKFRPLPERYNFIVSRDRSLCWEGQRLVKFVPDPSRLPMHSCDVGDYFAQIDNDLVRSFNGAQGLAAMMNAATPGRDLGLWCIGGAEVYAEFLRLAATVVNADPTRHSLRVFATRIHAGVGGDVRWPAAWRLDEPQWRRVSAESGMDAKFPHPYTFAEHVFVPTKATKP